MVIFVNNNPGYYDFKVSDNSLNGWIDINSHSNIIFDNISDISLNTGQVIDISNLNNENHTEINGKYINIIQLRGKIDASDNDISYAWTNILYNGTAQWEEISNNQVLNVSDSKKYIMVYRSDNSHNFFTAVNYFIFKNDDIQYRFSFDKNYIKFVNNDSAT